MEKKIGKVPHVKVHIPAITLEGIVFGEPVDQRFEQLYLFKVGDRVQHVLLEEGKIVLDHFITKRVEGVDVDTVGIRTNEIRQPLAHGHGAGIGVCEAENVVGQEVRIPQDLADA